MKKVLFVFLMGLICLAGAAEAAKNRKAMIIGVQNYESYTPLECTHGDVDKIEIMLKNAGFEDDYIWKMKDSGYGDNITASRMYSSILAFSRGIEKGDKVIFYFSGHGMGDKSGNNYLLGYDGNKDAPDKFSVNINEIRTILKEKQPAEIALIIDACRSFVKKAGKDAGKIENTNINTGKGVLIEKLTQSAAQFTPANNSTEQAGEVNKTIIKTIYSASEGQQSFERKDKNNGAFTYYLTYLVDQPNSAMDVDMNKDGIISVEDLVAFADNRLTDYTKRNNLPEMNPVYQTDGGIIYQPFALFKYNAEEIAVKRKTQKNDEPLFQYDIDAELAKIKKYEENLDYLNVDLPVYKPQISQDKINIEELDQTDLKSWKIAQAQHEEIKKRQADEERKQAESAAKKDEFEKLQNHYNTAISALEKTADLNEKYNMLESLRSSINSAKYPESRQRILPLLEPVYQKIKTAKENQDAEMSALEAKFSADLTEMEEMNKTDLPQDVKQKYLTAFKDKWEPNTNKIKDLIMLIKYYELIYKEIPQKFLDENNLISFNIGNEKFYCEKNNYNKWKKLGNLDFYWNYDRSNKSKKSISLTEEILVNDDDYFYKKLQKFDITLEFKYGRNKQEMLDKISNIINVQRMKNDEYTDEAILKAIDNMYINIFKKEKSNWLYNSKFGTLFIKGIDFYKNGYIGVLSLLLSQKINMLIGKLEINEIIFYESGEILALKLSESKKILTAVGELETKYIWFYKSGKIENIVLLEPKILKTPAGELKVDSIEFYENGNIESVYVSGINTITSTVGELEITNISFYKNGNIKSVNVSEINTITSTVGELEITNISFYESGKIKWCILSESKTLKATPVGELNINSIGFYESEKIERCILSKPKTLKTPIGELEVNEIRFYENGRIQWVDLSLSKKFKTPIGELEVENIGFYENGDIQRCYLSTPKSINTPVGKLNIELIEFYENGKIEWCRLSEPKTIKIPLGEMKVFSIGFYENGKIKMWNLFESKNIKTPVGELIVDSIDFYENGKISSIELFKSKIIKTPIGNRDIKFIGFYESGKIKVVGLVNEEHIQGKFFPKNTLIIFSEKGELLGKAKIDQRKMIFTLDE